MFNLELQRLEGVWTGTEQVSDGVNNYSSSGRLVFQTVFDGRFLLCDYVQTAPERPTAFAHGVFRQDEHSKALTVTWFRSPTATASQQANAVAQGDKPIFLRNRRCLHHADDLRRPQGSVVSVYGPRARRRLETDLRRCLPSTLATSRASGLYVIAEAHENRTRQSVARAKIHRF